MLEHIAKPLGMSVIEAANGIHRIVCEHMAAAAKIHAVEKGQDVRRYTLLAFGGAGPIHAREVARRSGCQEVLVPANAGVFSAFGLLVAPIKVDTVRTRFTRLESINWDATEALLLDMEHLLRDQLRSAGVPDAQMHFRRTADMRYVGQGFEVETELPARMHAGEMASLEERFNQAYAVLFGRHLTNQKMEIVNWRVEGFSTVSAMPSRMSGSSGGGKSHAARSRKAYFPDIQQFVDTPVIHETSLIPGEHHTGPALIEQAGSTVVVGPGDVFVLDAFGNIRVTLNPRSNK